MPRNRVEHLKIPQTKIERGTHPAEPYTQSPPFSQAQCDAASPDLTVAARKSTSKHSLIIWSSDHGRVRNTRWLRLVCRSFKW